MRLADDLACMLCQSSIRENHDAIEDGKFDHTVVLMVLRCGCAVVCGMGLDWPPLLRSTVPGANTALYCFALLYFSFKGGATPKVSDGGHKHPSGGQG